MKSLLLNKIKNKTLKIAVIGLGYVGVPMARLLIKNQYKVIGVDIDNERVIQLQKCKSYISDLTNEDIKEMFNNGFIVTTNYQSINDCDCVVICVSTPIDNKKIPDLTCLENCCRSLAKVIHKDMLIVLESTVYPGCTNNIVKPILETSGYIIGDDCFLAFSPERISPGEIKYTLENMNKVVSGINEKSAKIAVALYRSIIKAKINLASSIEVAEMAKLLENSYRYINIAFINEFTMLCNQLKIDIHQVIEIAKTKSIGYSAFYPNIKIGGHCIPVDPFYLLWTAKQNNVDMSMLCAAQNVLDSFFEHIINRIYAYMVDMNIALSDANMLVVGVAYKEYINDLRESPSIKLIEYLLASNIQCSYYDDMIDSVVVNNVSILRVKELTVESIKLYDLIILINDQLSLDKNLIVSEANKVFDIKNILKVRNDNTIVL